MSKKCSYFLETPPRDYSFLGFYQYRRQQSDFTFSFRKEALKLKSDLNELMNDDSEEVKTAVSHLLHNYKNHRERYHDVRVFWNEIESSTVNSNLHLDKVRTARTVMHGTRNLIKTAIKEIDRTLKPDESLVSNNKLDDDDVTPSRKKQRTDAEFPPSTSVQTSTIFKPDNVSTEELGDDEEIKFDLTNISMELKCEPVVKWEIGCINITDRFRCYQEDVLKKAEREGLKYENIYELLALSSIMVLCWPCPYPMFTNQEWEEITKTNPYIISEPPLPPEISSSLRDAVNRYLIGGFVFMERGNTELNKMVALMFNNLYYGIPEVAPSKLSEEEHCEMFIYPIARSFRKSKKEHELKLNRANVGSKTRPDLSCTVNGVPILNSEFKPLGCTPLQRKKDKLKVQLKARKSINQQLKSKRGPGEAVMFLNMGDSMESFFMDLKYDGLYRSWSFLTTKLVVDKATIPLAGFAISHFMALEERVEKIAKDFKYRSSQFTPPAQMSFVRKLPDSPQVKMLLH
ncbi:698_t:CDS:2 [Ambispora leptoticha]|uniref:698_t:CDS:1 n=1 Tax=Ambispora leptoticha TaxID=144679 RepID=A0A9N9D9N7_9GLOM|nr:698_t:CDS:2 [Ambispora leptoticha]